MSALIKAAGMTYDEAKTAVIESSVWADQRDTLATNQWIDPPETPDGPALERLREVCRTEPRIAEAWVTGSRFTRPDGHSGVSTSLALIFDPPEGGHTRRDRGRETDRALHEANRCLAQRSTW